MSLHGRTSIDAPANGRRLVLIALASAGFGGPASAQASKVWRLGWLSPADGPGPNHAAFLQRMKDLGYEEGKSFQMEWTWVGSNTENLAAAAARLVQSKPDLIITQSQICAQAAQKATKTIPVIFVGVRDPVAAGLVRSFSDPGANLTGLTLTPNDELVLKHLELLQEINPQASRLAVFWNPDVPVQAGVVELIAARARARGLSVRTFPVHLPGEIERAFDDMVRDGVHGLLTLVEWFTFGQRALIAKLAIEARIPTLFEVKDYVKAGGLIAYGVAYHEHFASAAHYVDKIIKGAKPRDLPVQQPAKLEIVLNVKTARAMGLTIPASVLIRADETIH